MTKAGDSDPAAKGAAGPRDSGRAASTAEGGQFSADAGVSSAYGTGDASYRAAGEYDGIVRLVDAFYRIMDELPEARTIRRMHPADLTESRDKLARFLSGWLNGPKLFREKYGPIRIPPAHAHLPIGPAERDAWLACMELAIAEQGYAPDFAVYLLRELRVPAERIVQVARGSR